MYLLSRTPYVWIVNFCHFVVHEVSHFRVHYNRHFVDSKRKSKIAFDFLLYFILTDEENIVYLGRKYPIPARRKNRNVSFLASVWGKIVYARGRKKLKGRAKGEGGKHEMWAGQFYSRGAYTIFPQTGAENYTFSVFAPGGNGVLSARCEEKGFDSHFQYNGHFIALKVGQK